MIDPNIRYVLGVDPGEITGIAYLEYKRIDWTWVPTGDNTLLQCDHKSIAKVLAWLTTTGYVLISHERFVNGLRASRSKKANAGQITRDINGLINGWHKTDTRDSQIRVVEHTASQVKSWCIPERLKAAELLLTPKMIHAQDAGAQALFAARYDLGAADPLSKRARLQEAYSGGSVHPLAQKLNKETPDVTVSPDGSVTLHNPGLFQYCSAIDAGTPGTDTAITFGSSSEVHDVLRRAIDSQAADQARYIGLNYLTQADKGMTDE